jgi:hypothetical protein
MAANRRSQGVSGNVWAVADMKKQEKQSKRNYEEWRLLGCYAVWLLYQKTPFFAVTAMKISNLT